MIVNIDDLAMDHVFQLFKVNHEARNRIDFSLHGHFKGVVVAMAVSIRTLAKKTHIFGGRQLL